jgi:hypothetical protein
MSHFEHGAMDKGTKLLVDPKSALKRTRYECPDCHRDVHVKKGEIRPPHFAHHPDAANHCTYYNRNPTLTQKHKNAQIKLRQFLEQGNEITIKRPCVCGCGWASNFGITCLPSNSVKCEHRFDFNDSKKSADVAVLDSNNGIICIFEVVHTHYTQERDRPEPWHEIKADEINAISSDEKDIILTCIRQKIRRECIEKQIERRAVQEKLYLEERIRRENERKERDAYHAEMERRWNEKQLEIEKSIREREQEQQQRNLNQKKAFEQKKQLEAHKKVLFKKHSEIVARCERCGPMAAWLKAGNSVGRCHTCRTKIDEFINKEIATTKLTE